MLIGLGPIIATGCGGDGGGSSGQITALSLPSRIELSNVEDTSSASSLSRALSGSARTGRAFNDAGTDYTNQTKDTWVDDTDALDMVNSILGACQDTCYENFVNSGPYRALVQSVSESKQSQGGASTTSSTTESLMELTVEVTRASNSAPMIVKVWVEEPNGPGGMPMLIRGYFEVTEAVSAQYPYGLLEAHFRGKMLSPDGSEGSEIFTMAMKIGADGGDVVIQFVESGDEGSGQFEWNNRVRVAANAAITQGAAYAYQYQNSAWDGERESIAYFAFNEDYFKVKVNDNEPKVYDKNDFNYRVFRYKLFGQGDGSKVTRNSGFPIQLSSGENAYIGYWGLWTPYGIDVNDGDTVTKVDTNVEYTLVKKRGKLRKHTKAQIGLADLDAAEMSYWNEGTDYVITWDSATQKFKKIGKRNQQNGQISYYPPAEQSVIDGINEWDGAWCEALSAFLPLGRLFKDDSGNPRDPANSDIIFYHGEQTISPATVQDLTLYYWGYAPDAPITQTHIDNAAQAEAAYWQNPPVEKTYFFDASELMLKEDSEDGDEFIVPAGLDLSGSIYECGLHMMPLTETPYTADDWWKAHDADEYYSWETGPNEWNQFATLRDSSGDYVEFDAPLIFSYTHSTANDLNGDATHNGKKFRIDYDGFELHIPWEFNPDAAAGHGWQPMFNLKDGTVLTTGTTDYVVKGIEVALIMKEVDPNLATDLEIDTSIEPPTLEYDATKTALVGDLPASTELKVIKGPSDQNAAQRNIERDFCPALYLAG
jgi:hypothetical protein